MVIAQPLHKVEGFNPLRVVPGKLTVAVEHRLLVFLHHVGVEQQNHVLIDHGVRIVVVAQFLLEHLPGGEEFVPGFRIGQPGFLPGDIVVVKDRRVNRDRQAVELAFDGGGLQIFGLILAEIKLALELIEVVIAFTVFGEDDQPRPVGLHHVRLGAAGHLGGQAREVPVPAGVFGLHFDIGILFLEGFQRFQRRLVTAIAAPPRHA